MSLKIIHEKCDKTLSHNKSLPLNSYLVTYIVEDKTYYDIVQSNGKVSVFDSYYDQYGKGSLQSIEWTDGRVNPKFYGGNQTREEKQKMNDKLVANIDPEEFTKIRKKYKKLKKYMKSPLYQVKVMDGTENIISELLKEPQIISEDTKLVD